MLRLALCLLAALPRLHEPPPAPSPDTPRAPASPATPAPSPTLADLPLAARDPASKRARFVYRLPDNSVWDSFYYVEFRKVLAEYDTLAKGAPLPASCVSWGFTTTRRAPADAANRPSPLWHTLQPPRENAHHTPFVYVNPALCSVKDRNRGPMLKCRKEVAPNIYEFTFTEYPGTDDAFVSIPCSVYLGYVAGFLRLPPGMHPATDGSLSGEFFLLSDPAAAKEAKSHTNAPGLKLFHAQDFRLTPDQYAAELLTHRAELTQWSFTRSPPSRFGDTFTWKKTTVEVEPAAPQPQAPTSK